MVGTARPSGPTRAPLLHGAPLLLAPAPPPAPLTSPSVSCLVATELAILVRYDCTGAAVAMAMDAAKWSRVEVGLLELTTSFANNEEVYTLY